jgi:hypothetical protein
MNSQTVFGLAASTLLVLVLASAAPAVDRPSLEPHMQGKVTYLTGGIGEEEQAAVREHAGEYNLWITLTRPDGAYLSKVEVRVENDAGETLLDTTTDGPFLLAKLPPGRYAIRTMAMDRHTERRTVDVPEQGQSRIYVAMPERR